MLLPVALSKVILGVLLVLLGLGALLVFLLTMSSTKKETGTRLLFIFTEATNYLGVVASHCALAIPSGVVIAFTLRGDEPMII